MADEPMFNIFVGETLLAEFQFRYELRFVFFNYKKLLMQFNPVNWSSKKPKFNPILNFGLKSYTYLEDNHYNVPFWFMENIFQ